MVTGRDSQTATVESDLEETVARYLLEEPDFLLRNPQVLNTLSVPHDCGGATSLIEAQVAGLKRQCADLNERLEALVNNARGNEELAQRLHRLVLDLLESASLDEIFTALYQGLAEGFGADQVSLRVFAEAGEAGDRGLAELMGDAGEVSLFSDLFAGGQPVCGALKPEQGVFLFGERVEQVGSAALLPLAVGERRGVLAIGAKSVGRYHPSMGTLYLRQLSDVLGRLIGRHVV